MKKVLFCASVAVLGMVFNSCKTDFETIAPYKEMVSVYGLIDHQSGSNYIRLNRVFLTDGDATQMAQNDDSVNYKPGELTVKLEKYKDGNLNNTFTLTETVTTLPAGEFNPNQRLWVCNNDLASFTVYSNSAPAVNGTEDNALISYKLKIHNNLTGKDFEGSTKLIKNFTFPLGGLSNLVSIDMTNPTYPRKLKWYNPIYGKTNNLIIRFHYKEFPTSDTTVYLNKYVDWNFNNRTVTDPAASNTEIAYEFMGEEFYNFLRNAISMDPGIYARKAGKLECIITAVGEEMQLFNEVNSPSNTIVQEKPIYTNITDGVGVFSSRTRQSFYLNLSSASLDKLAATATYPGSPTCALRFFDSNGVLGFGCQ